MPTELRGDTPLEFPLAALLTELRRLLPILRGSLDRSGISGPSILKDLFGQLALLFARTLVLLPRPFIFVGSSAPRVSRLIMTALAVEPIGLCFGIVAPVLAFLAGLLVISRGLVYQAVVRVLLGILFVGRDLLIGH
jgi:hypothetical protein